MNVTLNGGPFHGRSETVDPWQTSLWVDGCAEVPTTVTTWRQVARFEARYEQCEDGFWRCAYSGRVQEMSDERR